MRQLLQRRFLDKALAPNTDIADDIGGLDYHAISITVEGEVAASGAGNARPLAPMEILSRLDLTVSGEEVFSARGPDLLYLSELINGNRFDFQQATDDAEKFRATALLDFTKLMPGAMFPGRGDGGFGYKTRCGPATDILTTGTGYTGTAHVSAHAWQGNGGGAYYMPRFQFDDFPLEASSAHKKVRKIPAELACGFVLCRLVDASVTGAARHPDGMVSRVRVRRNLARGSNGPIEIGDFSWPELKELTAVMFGVSTADLRDGIVAIPLIDADSPRRFSNLQRNESIEIEFDTEATLQAPYTDVTLAAGDKAVLTWPFFSREGGDNPNVTQRR